MFAHPAVGSTGALQLCGPGGVVGCATSTARGIPPGRAPLPAPAEPRGLTAGPDAEEAWAPHTPSPPPVAGAPAFARPGPPAPASGKAPRPAPRSPDRPTAVTATAAAAAQASRLAGPRSVAALAAAAVAARSASASPHALAAALRAAGMAASVAGGDDGSPEPRPGGPKKHAGLFERSSARHTFVVVSPGGFGAAAGLGAPPGAAATAAAAAAAAAALSPLLARRPPPPPPPAAVLIVEPRLREAFEAATLSVSTHDHDDISAPAAAAAAPDEVAAYAALVRALPPVFVGDAGQLRSLVAWLAGRTEAAFRAAGRDLPPWRGAAAMMARWRLGEGGA